MSDVMDTTKIKHHFFLKKIKDSDHKYSMSMTEEPSCGLFSKISNSRKLAMKEIGLKEKHLSMLKQTHSNKVVKIDAVPDIGNEEKCDGQVSNKNIVLGIITADCVPVLFADYENNIIGAAHAGWRGARSDILKNTVTEMRNLGAEKITAIMGPCIHQKNYEVGSEVYKNFVKEDPNNRRFFINSEKENHHMFDLPTYVENKLNMLDLEKIDNINIDTYEDKENLFSYRRSTHQDLVHQGSILSVIYMEK